MEPSGGRKALYLENGSYVDLVSASPQTKIEGRTLHLVILEECQDIGDMKITKSIHPMLAATAGTMVKIGTPNMYKNEFYKACQRGRRSYIESTPQTQTHFEYDYLHCCRYNPRYVKFVEGERKRLGEDSDEFRMSYKLEWILERGMLITTGLFKKCSVRKRDVLVKKKGVRVLSKFTRPDYPSTNDQTTEQQVFGIDLGRATSSTVVTIARVWWDNPVDVGERQPRYHIHVVNWLELLGDDHERQHPQIMDFLSNYKVGMGAIDATGKGDPIYSRMAYELIPAGVIVHPVVYSQRLKHTGYTLMLQSLNAGRLSWPAGAGAKKLRKYRNFATQMQDLEKHWRGQWLTVAPPKKGKNQGVQLAKDDFPDSLMNVVYLVDHRAHATVDVIENNPFFRPDNVEAALDEGLRYFNRPGGKRGYASRRGRRLQSR